MEQEINGWGKQDTVALALEEMDRMVRLYRERREIYDAAKAEASKKYEEVEEIQNKITAALESAGKKAYKAEGVGTFSIVFKQQICIPKTPEEKQELYAFIEEKYGKDVLTSMLTIHHQTLNSFYNQEAENAEDPSLFHLPGIEAPTIKKEVRFRK